MYIYMCVCIYIYICIRESESLLEQNLTSPGIPQAGSTANSKAPNPGRASELFFIVFFITSFMSLFRMTCVSM